MASRLSEESLKAVYDAGHSALAIQSDQSLDILAPELVDLDLLLTAEDPKAAIEAVPPQSLYRALKQRGLEDAIDVLQHVSREQFVRFVDYDAWVEDRLAPLQAFKWLSLFKELGPEDLYSRFRELDEEYQLALLNPFIELYEEEQFEKLSNEEQDSMNRLPCGTLHYKVKSPDPKVEAFVEDLVEASLMFDINYTYALLSHAAYMPPNEQELQISQFRRARIEEDGFVTYEESLAAFRPLELAPLVARWRGGGSVDGLIERKAWAGSELFLAAAVQFGARTWTQDVYVRVQQGLAFLANTLCAAARTETDDLSGIRRVMQQTQALSSLGLEYITNGDLAIAAQVLAEEHPKVMFRAGLSVIGQLQEAVTSRLEAADVPRALEFKKLWRSDKRGALIRMIEQDFGPVIGFERGEMLKGLFNRFPVRPERLAIGQDGIERMLYRPIASLAHLRELAATLDGFAGLLHLATLARDEKEQLIDLDRTLLTGLGRVLAGGAFKAHPLTDDEVARIVALPHEAAQALASDFLVSVEGSLRMDLIGEEGPGDSWSVSRAADLHPGQDPLQVISAEVSDLLLRLATSRESARTSGADPAAILSQILSVQSRAKSAPPRETM